MMRLPVHTIFSLMLLVMALVYVGIRWWQIEESASFFGEEMRSDGLWLLPSNSHVAQVTLTKKFMGVLRGYDILGVTSQPQPAEGHYVVLDDMNGKPSETILLGELNPDDQIYGVAEVLGDHSYTIKHGDFSRMENQLQVGRKVYIWLLQIAGEDTKLQSISLL